MAVEHRGRTDGDTRSGRWVLVGLVTALVLLSVVVLAGVVGLRDVQGAEGCSINVAGQPRDLSPDSARRQTDIAAAAKSTAGLTARLDGDGELANTLLGASGPALTCAAAGRRLSREAEGRQGLTPRALRLRAAMEHAFGHLPL